MNTPEKIKKLLFEFEYSNLKELWLKVMQIDSTISYHMLYNLQTGKTAKISTKVRNAILKLHPEVNEKWLMTGEGNFVVTESSGNSPLVTSENINKYKSFEELVQSIPDQNLANRLLVLHMKAVSDLQNQIINLMSNHNVQQHYNTYPWGQGRIQFQRTKSSSKTQYFQKNSHQGFTGNEVFFLKESFIHQTPSPAIFGVITENLVRQQHVGKTMLSLITLKSCWKHPIRPEDILEANKIPFWDDQVVAL